MGELNGRMPADIAIYLLPVVAVVPNLLAVGTYGKQPLKLADLRESLLQLFHTHS